MNNNLDITMAHDDALEENTALEENSISISPISKLERIDLMDILRGFALVGILFMNIEWFNRPTTELGNFDLSLTGMDYAAGWLIRVFIEAKFYKLFAILFGMGFAVMLIRAQKSDQPFTAWFIRRMVLLFILGMAHMVFLWSGDILHDYAFAGLLLLGVVLLLKTERLQKYNHSKLYLKIGLTMIVLPFVAAILAGLFFGVSRDQDKIVSDWNQRIEVRAKIEELKLLPEDITVSDVDHSEINSSDLIEERNEEEKNEDDMTHDELIMYKAEKRLKRINERAANKQEEISALTQKDYWAANNYRVDTALDNLKHTPIMGLLMLLPLFMIGYWFVSSGILNETEKHLLLFKNMTWIGLGIGLLLSMAALFPLSHPANKDAFEIRGVAQVIFGFSQYLMTAGYIGAIALITQTVTGKRFLSWLAPLGRMALTNYIMHSIILSSLFFGYAGDMYGLISRAPQMLIVVAIILFQVLLSRWWLKNYLYGPLEWLWRSMTYLKVLPMRIKQSPAKDESIELSAH